MWPDCSDIAATSLQDPKQLQCWQTHMCEQRVILLVQEVYAKVHEIMTGNLGAAGTSQGLNISPGSQGLLIVCASMRVLGVLEECCKDYANRFTHVLVKLINRVARDHASPGGFVLDSSRQAGRSRCIRLRL